MRGGVGRKEPRNESGRQDGGRGNRMNNQEVEAGQQGKGGRAKRTEKQDQEEGQMDQVVAG